MSTPLDHAGLALVSLAPARALDCLRNLTGLIRKLNSSHDVVATLALGASAFTRAGLDDRRPAQLDPMPSFPGDLLLPERSHADVLLQMEANTPERARSELDKLLHDVPDLKLEWRTEGRRPENNFTDGQALTRNPFGFTEGFGNPTARTTPTADQIALISGRTPTGTATGEPDWAIGGSYLAVRVVRLAQELWDTDSVATQERVIGRHRDGTWLDGTPATHEPHFASDLEGAITPLDAHVRRANPRHPGQAGPPLLRRSWTYDAGQTTGDQPDRGIFFMCYQRDLKAGFEAVQHRLQGQALDLYLLTVGGGYFVVPPPDRNGVHWEERLLQ